MDIRSFAKVCLRLAQGDSVSLSNQLRDEGSTAVDKLFELASAQKVTPLIVSHLCASNYELALTPQQATFLNENRPVATTARAAAMKAQLLEIDAALAGTEIRPVLLKGAIQLFHRLYPSVGMRHMADIDIMSTNPDFITALEGIGYGFAFEEDALRNQHGKPEDLRTGEHHLSPRARPNDVTTIEPHISPVAVRHAHLIPSDFETNTQPVNGCTNIKAPSPENYLLHMVIHSVVHDRDVFGSGLVLRGILECELIFEQLSTEQQKACESHFRKNGADRLWNSWRALADWVFHEKNNAQYRSPGAFLLIGEFSLRAKNHVLAFVLSVASRFLALLDYRYWSSQTYVKHLGRYRKKNFWVRLIQKARDAFNK